MRDRWLLRSLNRASLLFVAGLVLLAAGCPSAAPPAANKSAKEDDALADNPDDVKALEAAKAILSKDGEGRVVGVELNRDKGNDADLAHVKGLPHVRELSADVRNVTDAGLAHLVGHPNLRIVRLEQSAVTDAGMLHMQKLPKLEELDLRRSGGITLEGYRHVGKIKSLKRLIVVFNTKFNDACLEAIKDLKNLEVLDLQDCNQVTEKGLVVLKGFPKLKKVRLWGPAINEKVLANLAGAKELRSLSLEQCSNVNEAALDHIKGLANLQELMLFGARGVTDAGLAKLSGLTKLNRLELRETTISSLGLSHLKELKGLKVLNLAQTANVGNEGLDHLRGLTNLEELDLWATAIDDGGLAHLAGMKKLKWLKLDQCAITDEGMPHLAGLTDLEYLHIGSTKVTDAGLAKLAGLKNLKTLVVTFLDNVTEDGVKKLEESIPGLTEIER